MDQGEAKCQRRRKHQVIKLVSKIRRLKNKLISYGMTGKESIDAILYEFLKAPQIDWTLPHNTTTFYQIQNKYHTDHNTAELILILNAIVPNWEIRSVVEYLHETLTYNALAFGIDLDISDDSSNQDGNDMTLLLIKAKKKNSQFVGLKAKKRSHISASSSSSVLFYNALKDIQHSDQELQKRVHCSTQHLLIQKVQQLKPQRKQTQQNMDFYPPDYEQDRFTIKATNQNTMKYSNSNIENNNVYNNMSNPSNEKSGYQESHQTTFRQRKQNQLVSSQEHQESIKRRFPLQIEHLDDQKLEKRVKK